MPKKKFKCLLTQFIQYTVEFITDKGSVIGFVIRLRAFIDGKWYEVRRYDTAHGTPHIDVLNWRGKTIEKIWLPQLPPSEAMTFAINDIKINFKTYIRRFKNG